MTILAPTRNLWLPPLGLWLAERRKVGGARLRAGGGRTRKQDCCCDASCDDDTCATGATLTISGFQTSSCTDGDDEYEELWGNINGNYSTTDLDIDATGIVSTFHLGTVADGADRGVLVHTKDVPPNPFEQWYVYQMDTRIECHPPFDPDVDPFELCLMSIIGGGDPNPRILARLQKWQNDIWNSIVFNHTWIVGSQPDTCITYTSGTACDKTVTAVATDTRSVPVCPGEVVYASGVGQMQFALTS